MRCTLVHERMQIVDQFDQVAVLEVHRSNADAEFVFPFNQAHRKLNPPVDALNVTVK